MSETPRVWSSRGSGFSVVRRHRSRRIRNALLLASAALFVYGFWISRDTHPIAEFVESGRGLELVIPRANAARHRLAESRVWAGAPEDWAAGWPRAMADTRGLPEWIVGNLVGSGAIAVADDLAGWSDLVVASKMTRAGCVIERALRFSPSNTGEWAGGLGIRFWQPGALHYAVRGRTLLLSPSRDALVRSLTLAQDRRVAPEAVREALADAGVEDARGTIAFREGTELGRVLSELRFAVRIEEGEALVKMRATFRPELADDLAEEWGNTAPAALAPPFDAPVTLSADFGTSVEDTWRAFSELLDVEWLTAEQWESWREEDAADSPAAVLAALLGPMGTNVRLAWQGSDLNEMAPTPILVGSVEGSRAAAEAILEALPARGGIRTADARVYYDGDTGTVSAPLMSGPSMSPTGRWDGNNLYFSTSAAAADAFLNDGRAKTLAAPREGNLFIRVNPGAATREFVAAGVALAEGDLLRSYTAAEFEAASKTWIQRADALESLQLLASVNNRQIEAEFYVKCVAAPATTER